MSGAAMIHFPTVEYVRAMLAQLRTELPVKAPDRVRRGAALIADDMVATLDNLLAELVSPPTLPPEPYGDLCAAIRPLKLEAA